MGEVDTAASDTQPLPCPVAAKVPEDLMEVTAASSGSWVIATISEHLTIGLDHIGDDPRE